MNSVNILGVEYTIDFRTEQEDPKLKECSGYCDESVRQIVVERRTGEDVMGCKDQEMITRKVLRHEIVHAFVAESGLAECCEWAQNEEMVDWIARQFPKTLKAFYDVGALE